MLPGDGAYLVMERLHGRTLRVELGRAGMFAPAVSPSGSNSCVTASRGRTTKGSIIAI